jgi:hypothetical protein
LYRGSSARERRLYLGSTGVRPFFDRAVGTLLRMTRRRIKIAVLLVPLVAVAAAGWTRAPGRPVPRVRVVDVDPLATRDAGLGDVLAHYFAVRVATSHWPLLRARADVSGLDARPRLRHWRLYVDGATVGDTFTDVAYTPYLRAGTHWLAVELRAPDHRRLQPPVWSEPIVLQVPKRMRCWQTGWHGSPETGTPTFACRA